MGKIPLWFRYRCFVNESDWRSLKSSASTGVGWAKALLRRAHHLSASILCVVGTLRLPTLCFWGDQPARISALIMSAAFSPIMMVGALVLPPISVGMIEASTTRNPSTPYTFSFGSTAAIGSLTPILQVPTG